MSASGVDKIIKVGGGDVGRAGSRTTTQRVRVKEKLGVSRLAKRKRGGRQFFITVELLEIYEGVREDFLAWFEGVLTFCVAVEISRVSSRVSNHLHAFLEFDNDILLADMNDYVRACLDGLHFDLQACRSKKTVLKYITKEDRVPLYNCKMSMLHFNYRSYVWAKYAKRFSCEDPFVQEHRFCYKYLERLFADVKCVEMGQCVLKPLSYFSTYWTFQCVKWWNEKICKSVHKSKQLFLYGNSNVGKTTFVELLIGRVNLKYVFYPGVGKFFMQGYREGFHKIIVFEEFNGKFHCMSMLKRLVEGKMYAYPVKCGADALIQFKGPIMFVSNYDYEEADDAMKNRLLFVSADEAFWEVAEKVLPKEENAYTFEEEVQVCEISDEEEEHKAAHLSWHEKSDGVEVSASTNEILP